MKLYEQIRSVAAKMKIDYEEISAAIHHSGEKGTAREDIVKTFLTQYLPQKYTIERGIIINSLGLQSNQQDIFIYDNDITPRFSNFEHVKIVPVESVRCVIEVKSVLTTDELKKALANVSYVRGLEKRFFNKEYQVPYPFGLVVAFESQITLKKIKEELLDFVQKNGGSSMPTIVLVLDRGSIASCEKNDPLTYALFPTPEAVWTIQETPEIGDNLMLMYLMIVTGLFLNNPFEFQPDISTYAKNSGFIAPSRNLHVDELKGARFEIDGQTVDVDKMVALQKSYMSMSQEERMSPAGITKMLTAMSEALPDMGPDWSSMIREIRGEEKGHR